MKALFKRNGSTPLVVSSIDDIKKSLGELMQHFDDVVIHDNLVLAQKGGEYVAIGTIQYC